MSVHQTSSYTTGFQEHFSSELNDKQRATGLAKVISYCMVVIHMLYGLVHYQAVQKERKYVKINKALDAPAEKSKQAFQDKLLVPHLIEALKRDDGEHFKKGFPLLTPEGQMRFFEKVDEKQYITIFDLLKDQTEFHIRVRSLSSNSNRYVDLMDCLKNKNGEPINQLHLHFDFYSENVSALLRALQKRPKLELLESIDEGKAGFALYRFNISNIVKVLKLAKEIKTSNESLYYEIEFDKSKVSPSNMTADGTHYQHCEDVQDFMEGRPIREVSYDRKNI